MSPHSPLSPASDARPAFSHEAAVTHIAQALDGLKFGAISVVVHDGRVTQIDVTEKRRLSV